MSMPSLQSFIEQDWLYIVLLLVTALGAFGSGLLIGGVWILLI